MVPLKVVTTPVTMFPVAIVAVPEVNKVVTIPVTMFPVVALAVVKLPVV